MQPPFESWFLSSPPVPPRSRLYSLEPIGIGTAFVESLTGYTARLAEAHSVSVGDLVGRVLSELLSDPKAPIITAAAKACRVGGHGFRACRYGVNGVTDRAESWAQALEAATARRDLRYLNGGLMSGSSTSRSSGPSKRRRTALSTPDRSIASATTVRDR
jgi:hypothetical protein